MYSSITQTIEIEQKKLLNDLQQNKENQAYETNFIPNAQPSVAP